MPRLLLLTAGELTRDPRARRTAEAAARHGFDVVGISGGLDGGSPTSLPGVEVIRVARPRVTTALRAVGLGGPTPTRSTARELRGAFRLVRLLLFTKRLVQAARPLGHVDVVHAHDLDALPAGEAIARRAGARLVYDAHEIYSEADVDPPRLARSLLLRLERRLARRADAVVTVSEAIAGVLERTLRLRQRPFVVRNLPRLIAVPQQAATAPSGLLRVVYQAGADLPIRPLDLIFDSAVLATGVDITIRMLDLDAERCAAEITRRGLANRVRIVPPVDPADLIGELASFDAGLVVQLPLNENARLGLPNKLFEYLMAGLAVVVPDLPALAEIVDGEDLGLTYEPSSAESLAVALTRLDADRDLLAACRERARGAAVERYNAAMDESTLLRAWGL